MLILFRKVLLDFMVLPGKQLVFSFAFFELFLRLVQLDHETQVLVDWFCVFIVERGIFDQGLDFLDMFGVSDGILDQLILFPQASILFLSFLLSTLQTKHGSLVRNLSHAEGLWLIFEQISLLLKLIPAIKNPLVRHIGRFQLLLELDQSCFGTVEVFAILPIWLLYFLVVVHDGFHLIVANLIV